MLLENTERKIKAAEQGGKYNEMDFNHKQVVMRKFEQTKSKAETLLDFYKTKNNVPVEELAVEIKDLFDSFLNVLLNDEQ